MTTVEGINPTALPSGAGCADCDDIGGWWFHLRRCAQCGHIGCCDTSPSQHAAAHYKTSGHEFIQSFEPGEDWFYNFRADEMCDGPKLADPTAHPVDQPTPGPSGRVPADWQLHLH
jgi:hypothetical protein